MDGKTSPGQSHSLTFGVRNMVWKCLVWPGVRDVLTTWRWDKKSNNQKAAQAPGTGTGHPTTTLGERNFHARFSNNRMASSHHFLKPVHKRTSWLLVSPKENWEKKIPTKKKQTENSYHFFPSFTRRLRIPLAVFYLAVTQGPSSLNFPLPTKWLWRI